MIFLVILFDVFLQGRVTSSSPNSGVSFGAFPGISPFLIFLLFLFFSMWSYSRWDSFRKLERVGVFMVVSGGLGNFLSRVVYGEVLDYIYAGALAFNMSDVVITSGSALFILDHVIRYVTYARKT